MKKIALFLILTGIFLVGCEKKESPQPTVSGDLKVWVSEQGDFWEALGREFISVFASPDLKLTVVRFESDEELQTTLLSQMSEAKGPDVIVTDGDWIAHNTGKFTSLRNDPGLGIEKFQQFFVPSSYELLVQNEAVWGVPIAIDTLAVVYNAGHFAESFDEGVEVGKTWEEFRDQVSLLNKKDNSFKRFSRSGGAIGRVDNTKRGIETFLNLFVQLSGDLFSEDKTESIFAGNNGITDTGERVDYALQALKFYLGFANESVSYHSWNELLVDSESEHKDFELFVQGDVSLVFATARDMKEIESLFTQGKANIPENNIRIGFLPQFKSPEENVPRKIMANVTGMAVPASSRDQQMAWQFLKFAIRSENLQGFFRSSGVPSPHKELLTQQESEEGAEIFVRQAKVAQGHLFPLSKKQMKETFSTLITRVQANKATPSEALLQAEETLTHKLQRIQTLLQTLSP